MEVEIEGPKIQARARSASETNYRRTRSSNCACEDLETDVVAESSKRYRRTFAVSETICSQSGSLTLPKLHNFPCGLPFFSWMNKRKRFFLPSSENYFGGVQVRRVLPGSRCSSLLIPFESVKHLKQVLRKLGETCCISVEMGNSVGVTSPCLVFTYRATRAFSVDLCKDIIPEKHRRIYVPSLRFSLCADDIKELCGGSKKYLVDGCIERLKTFEGTLRRRKYGLLGRNILSQYLTVKYRDAEFFMDTIAYETFPHSCRGLDEIIELLKNHLSTPVGFDDWDNDDFSYDDDEVLHDEADD